MLKRRPNIFTFEPLGSKVSLFQNNLMEKETVNHNV